MRRMRHWTLFTIAAVALLLASTAGAQEKAAGQAKEATKAKSEAATDEIAILETSRGRMVIEFWEKDAPKTVENFKKLARKGFYDGTGFHRIVKNFMIQGGDPGSKNPNAPNLGSGGPGYTIPDEFGPRKHVKGVISMAHTAAPNSGGSQFFIMHAPYPSLDGQYAAFGRLIHGIDVLDEIANTPVEPNKMMGGEKSKPLEWTTLKSVKIVSRSEYAKMQAAEKKAAADAAAAAAAKQAAAKKAAEEASAAKKEAAKAATDAARAEQEKTEAERAKAEAERKSGEKKAGEGGGSY